MFTVIPIYAEVSEHSSSAFYEYTPIIKLRIIQK